MDNPYAGYFYNGQWDEYGPMLEEGTLEELVEFYAAELVEPEEPVIDRDSLRELLEALIDEREEKRQAKLLNESID